MTPTTTMSNRGFSGKSSAASTCPPTFSGEQQHAAAESAISAKRGLAGNQTRQNRQYWRNGGQR